MRIVAHAVCVFVSIGAFGGVAGAAVTHQSTYAAARATHPLGSDNTLSDPDWARGRITQDDVTFEDITTRAPAAFKTTAYLLSDAANLYVGFEVLQPKFTITAAQPTNDVGFGLDFSNVEVDEQSIAPQEFLRVLTEYRPFFAEGNSIAGDDSTVEAGTSFHNLHRGLIGMIDEAFESGSYVADPGHTRQLMEMVALFAGTALLVAGLGIYGTISFVVHEQSREIAIRLALVAQRSNNPQDGLAPGPHSGRRRRGRRPALRCLALRSFHLRPRHRRRHRRQLRPCAARHARRSGHYAPIRLTVGTGRVKPTFRKRV
jgi:hypothetical protein